MSSYSCHPVPSKNPNFESTVEVSTSNHNFKSKLQSYIPIAHTIHRQHSTTTFSYNFESQREIKFHAQPPSCPPPHYQLSTALPSPAFFRSFQASTGGKLKNSTRFRCFRRGGDVLKILSDNYALLPRAISPPSLPFSPSSLRQPKFASYFTITYIF